MKKMFFVVLFLFVSFSSFANSNSSNTKSCLGDCPKASETNLPQFCPTFIAAARCQCVARGLPAGMCQDVLVIYDRMLKLFGTIQKACAFQKDVPTQECIDDWNCYLAGGRDSKGRLCSGNGASCR